jgi:TfuA protein
MSAIVFSGPSLAEADLRRLSTATHAPPIKRGDLANVGDYDIVVILDGEFGQSESVSPKEILGTIERGKTVIGAASMGALRASELDRDGMIGVGWVYEHFRRQAVRRDADVALAYSAFNFEAMSVPMVDVEYWMERASAAGMIGNRERIRLLKAARSIFFADRTTDRLVDSLRRAVGDRLLQSLLEFSGGGIPSIKSHDALEAVRLSASYAKARAAG